MVKISFKKILIAFGIIFLMSRTGKILDWWKNFRRPEILTLEPLGECSEEMRFVVTLAFLFLIFVIIWHVLLRNR